MELSFYGIVELGIRFRQLGKCSKCSLYPKCKGVKLLCDNPDNPDDNPENPRKNPDNPCKNCKIIKEK